MASESGKNKTNHLSAKRYEKKSMLLRRTYTTRQVMELTELRRRQQALVEETPKLSEPPAAVEPPSDTLSTESSQAVADSPVAQPVQDLEKSPGFGPVISPVAAPALDDAPLEIVDPGLNAPVSSDRPSKNWLAKPLVHIQSFFGYLGQTVMDGLLTAGSFVLFVVMLTHIMSLGTAPDRYAQGPFLMLAIVLTMWFERGRLYRGRRAFILGIVSFLMGVAVFAIAVLQSLMYMEILGFVLTCAGIFCARYARETATRMLPALLCLFFAVEPPEFFVRMASVPVNDLIAQASLVCSKFLQVPVSLDTGVLNVGGYEFWMGLDSTALRMIIVTVPLAILYAHHVSQMVHRKWIVVGGAIPLALLAAIIHTIGTGWVLYNYGSEYAGGFYYSPGVVLLSVLGVMALVDTLFKEDNHF